MNVGALPPGDPALVTGIPPRGNCGATQVFSVSLFEELLHSPPSSRLDGPIDFQPLVSLWRLPPAAPAEARSSWQCRCRRWAPTVPQAESPAQNRGQHCDSERVCGRLAGGTLPPCLHLAHGLAKSQSFGGWHCRCHCHTHNKRRGQRWEAKPRRQQEESLCVHPSSRHRLPLSSSRHLCLPFTAPPTQSHSLGAWANNLARKVFRLVKCFKNILLCVLERPSLGIYCPIPPGPTLGPWAHPQRLPAPGKRRKQRIRTWPHPVRAQPAPRHSFKSLPGPPTLSSCGRVPKAPYIWVEQAYAW